MTDWRPTASREALQQRASLLAALRGFFAERSLLEVETPMLSVGATTDPTIESFALHGATPPRYLHTSPEFPMKRLLAAGSGDIYQICRVFRQGERGRFHNPEFTLVEWYRLGWDDARLASEVVELALRAAESLDLPADFEVARLSYAEVFAEVLGIDPHRAPKETLIELARTAGVAPEGELTRDGWLDLLMGLAVAPAFPAGRLTVVSDYPATQAALARIREGYPPTAARFEVFGGSLELANGFHELTDAGEQARRFAVDEAYRVSVDAPERPADRRLIAALEAGLPDCAGVALGVDRLLLWLTGRDDLAEVIAFPWERA
ncbi:EF-P lysine aminoacylase GenX [Acidihalobacter aeolianus]|uniref:EF-P lysine aminoacylase GenX n=1 Tax=Acidihalobacter aeolianus TaxID=2792603 RepID=A0A1D8K8C2_9GAMM|nr:EF-P lysine aminoacylase EpmA [Acidihalobacter aeolianus]AOV17227.1 EF-P lysine aminoacylase GenX [Acidihalobacter aeolianus]